MARILIIEDDRAVRTAVTDAVAAEGHTVLAAETGPAGLEQGLTQDPDLILLDILLPGLDGYELLRRLRADAVEAPVMMISAKGQEIDKVRALELGADDYLTKPFGLAELMARVRAQLRRARTGAGQSMAGLKRHRDLEIDLDARTVRKKRTPVELTRTEFDLLALFLGAPGKAFGRDEILNRIWGHEHIPGSRTLDNHIAALRRKLEDDPARPALIESVRGVGYRLTRS
ncbi:MAG: response regulator transcription factor [Planctomycetes bacterium]|nr:response regulator transcription factor [Planctomycetota bacterium]